jgi:hypothetical protein
MMFRGRRKESVMSTTIMGVVSHGVVVPNTPLPEGARVEIHLLGAEMPSANPLLNFQGHLDPNDPLEKEFMEELARLKREDLERTLREDEECSNSSSIPTT